MSRAMSNREAYTVMLKEYPDVMNIEQMSQALGISTKTGYQLLRRNAISSLRIGRTYRIPKVHIITYLRIDHEDTVS